MTAQKIESEQVRRLNASTRVLAEVLHELDRQHAMWGEQNHPDMSDDVSAGRAMFAGYANRYKRINAVAATAGDIDWTGIFLEEVYEALAESDPALIRAELVQAAAVAVQWCAAIDRRLAGGL